MASDVLRGGVDRDIHTRNLEAALVEGGGEGRVAHHPRLGVPRGGMLCHYLADRLEVGQPAGRVCRRFSVHYLGGGAECGGVGGRVRRVDERVLDAPMLRKLDQKLVRPSVDREGEDRVVAGLENRHQRSGDGRHAGREEHAAAVAVWADALERRHLPRRALVGGRAPARVHVPVPVGVGRLALGVQPRAVRRVVELERGAEHNWQRERLDAPDRVVADLDDAGAAGGVAVLIPARTRRADRHAVASRTGEGHVAEQGGVNVHWLGREGSRRRRERASERTCRRQPWQGGVGAPCRARRRGELKAEHMLLAADGGPTASSTPDRDTHNS
mmetsp:Transcript_41000/g.132871  ORF Transcript_41000/g.132871 Transcript_41000/m.132871 type:complete len:329 (+) Transcript_41000:943-1929(+)